MLKIKPFFFSPRNLVVKYLSAFYYCILQNQGIKVFLICIHLEDKADIERKAVRRQVEPGFRSNYS